MKKEKKFDIDLQMFAENENNESDNNGGNENKDEKKEFEQQKLFKERENETKELNNKISKLEEIIKSITEKKDETKEKKDEKTDETSKRIEELENKLRQKELQIEAEKQLSKNGLSDFADSLIDLVMDNEVSRIEKNIETIKTIIDKGVEKKIEDMKTTKGFKGENKTGETSMDKELKSILSSNKPSKESLDGFWKM